MDVTLTQIRRQAREAALVVLFSDEFPSSAPFEAPSDSYAISLVDGVRVSKARIDDLLGKAGAHWRIERMGLVDRNVLRIAVWELLQGVPVGVAIDEAIEIARRFGDVGSAAFANGVLDAVAQAL